MTCHSPMLAWPGPVNDNNKRPLVFKCPPGMTNDDALELPCGGCQGCRLDKSREWATRCMHEASCHSENCYITLTYSPENTPQFGDLCYKHFQDFMKRVRSKFPEKQIKFYMCGEYGENLEHSKNGRYGHPHYHACLFGLDFPDRRAYKQNKNGDILYTSETLEKLWSHGFTTIGDLTWQSAAYVARYVMKKQTGKALTEPQSNGFRAYECLLSGGEIVTLKSEFNRMSTGGRLNSGGIGKKWFDRYKGDLKKDFITYEGEKMKVPKYYDNLLAKEDPHELDRRKLDRAEKARIKRDTENEVVARRWDQRKIQEKTVKRLKRTL
jgi:uncharacterized protein YodC (DUF2158 family)